MALFRAGNDEAFRVIYERYRARLFAYTRQMLPFSRQDAEDALQDVFVRAYRALRSSDRDLALRPWLYRVAHNRCVDELRRPAAAPVEVLDVVRPPEADPLAAAERHDDLRRLVTDLGRLPDQQRSALLMREIDGLCYADVAAALDTSIPAVKSLLVRARMGLAQASEARETACADIRGQLTMARDRGVRASGQARRHLRDCPSCRAYKGELRSVERRLAAFVPALGPVALAAKLFGIGGAATGGSAAGSAGAGAGAAAGGAAAGSGVAGGALVTAAAGKVVAVVAVAAVAGGAAVDVQHHLAPPPAQTAPAAAPAAARAAAPATRPHAHPAQAQPAGHATTIRFFQPAKHAAAPAQHAHRAAAAPATTVTSSPDLGSTGQDAAANPATAPSGDDPTGTTTTDPTASDPSTDPTDATDPTTTTGTATTGDPATDPVTGEPVAGASSTSTTGSDPATTPVSPSLPGAAVPLHLR